MSSSPFNQSSDDKKKKKNRTTGGIIARFNILSIQMGERAAEI